MANVSLLLLGMMVVVNQLPFADNFNILLYYLRNSASKSTYLKVSRRQ